MKRFLLLSLVVHLALAAGIFFSLREKKSEEPALELSAGDVFVGENPNLPPAEETKKEEVVPDSVPAPKEEPAPLPVEPKVSTPPLGMDESAAPSGPPETGGSPSLGVPDSEAKLGRAVTISYPPISVRNAEAGEVTIALELSSVGEVVSAKVEKSSGFARLDEAALKSLSEATFDPAIREGGPSASRKEITVVFQLQNGKPGVEIAPEP